MCMSTKLQTRFPFLPYYFEVPQKPKYPSSATSKTFRLSHDCPSAHVVTPKNTLMALHNTAVTQLLTHWSYYSLALSHRCYIWVHRIYKTMSIFVCLSSIGQDFPGRRWFEATPWSRFSINPRCIDNIIKIVRGLSKQRWPQYMDM